MKRPNLDTCDDEMFCVEYVRLAYECEGADPPFKTWTLSEGVNHSDHKGGTASYLVACLRTLGGF